MRDGSACVLLIDGRSLTFGSNNVFSGLEPLRLSRSHEQIGSLGRDVNAIGASSTLDTRSGVLRYFDIIQSWERLSEL